MDKVLTMIPNRKLILWGAGWYVKSFIENYCGSGKLLPMPYGVCDSTRVISESEIAGVPVIAFSDVTNMSPDETAIIMTAGLIDLMAKVVPNELYYFPIYHRRTFEAYAYIKQNLDLCDAAISLLADENSKYIYRRKISNMITGSFWDQSLYEGNAYFGNDLIDKIPPDGQFVFAGAFNGKHIIRALKNTPDVKVTAFEPSSLWYSRLVEKFSDNPNIKIHNNILWDDFRQLPFEEDESNSGLTAHVTMNGASTKTCMVDTITIDEVSKNQRVSHIALDVEGSEQLAVKGAVGTILRDHPSMCLCLYHTYDDYFNLPILVNDIAKGSYKLYVKQHSCISAIETVLYAV